VLLSTTRSDEHPLVRQPHARLGTRIRDATGGTGGGLVANNIVPNGFVPGESIGEPQSDRFPLLVWDGVLTDGIDGLLVVPSLWERDATGYLDYESRWLAGSPSQTLTLVLPRMTLPGLVANEAAITATAHLYTLTDLAAHVSINYAEPAADRVLGGNYTLSLRVERTQ
jgi:hypothetical protein